MSQENQNEIENNEISEKERKEQEEREKREEYLAKKAAILFVHGLDKRVDENMIYRLFNNYSVSYIKLAKEEKTANSLGYAFVGFRSRDKAGQALQEVNYSRLMNKTVRLSWYDRTANNARKKPENNVFVKNIPKNVSSREFHEFFAQFGKILAAKVAEDEEGDSLGYGYVLYEDTNCAKKAIEETHGKPWKDTDMKLYVCQLERKRPRKPIRFNNLYVRNIPKDWDVEQLKKYFSKYGEISSAIVRSPKKERVDKNTPNCISSNIFVHQYGFVCFKSIDGPAEKAVIKVPYLKLNDEAYNKQVEEYAQIFREQGIKEEDVYKCTCYVHEYKLDDKMSTEEGLAEIKKSFLELMDFYDGHYVVRNADDRLHCCRAMKKKEREKLLRIICERLKTKVRARYKFCNLYVKHLPDNFDKEKLLQLFGEFGPIRSARILRSAATDNSFKFIKRKTRVFAYVCFLDPEQAKKAIKKLNGKEYIRNGPRLYVDYHQTKKERLQFLKLRMMRRFDLSPYMDQEKKGLVQPGMPNAQMVPGMPNVQLAPGMPNVQMAPGMPNVQMVPGVANAQIVPGMPNVQMVPVMPNVQMVHGIPSTQMVHGMPLPQVMPVGPNIQIPIMPNVQVVPVNPNIQMTQPNNQNVQMTQPVNTNIQIARPSNANAQVEQPVDNDSQIDINENDENIFNRVIPFEHHNEKSNNYSQPHAQDIRISPHGYKPLPVFKEITGRELTQEEINWQNKIYEKLGSIEKYSKYQYLYQKIAKVLLRLRTEDLKLLCDNTELFIHHMDNMIPVIIKEMDREAKAEKKKSDEQRKQYEEEREADLWKVGVERHYEGEEEDIMTEEEQKKYELDLTKDVDWEKFIGFKTFLDDDEK